jgi:hypothetical protein
VPRRRDAISTDEAVKETPLNIGKEYQVARSDDGLSVTFTVLNPRYHFGYLYYFEWSDEIDSSGRPAKTSPDVVPGLRTGSEHAPPDRIRTPTSAPPSGGTSGRVEARPWTAEDLVIPGDATDVYVFSQDPEGMECRNLAPGGGGAIPVVEFLGNLETYRRETRKEGHILVITVSAARRQPGGRWVQGEVTYKGSLLETVDYWCNHGPIADKGARVPN